MRLEGQLVPVTMVMGLWPIRLDSSSRWLGIHGISIPYCQDSQILDIGDAVQTQVAQLPFKVPIPILVLLLGSWTNLLYWLQFFLCSCMTWNGLRVIVPCNVLTVYLCNLASSPTLGYRYGNKKGSVMYNTWRGWIIMFVVCIGICSRIVLFVLYNVRHRVVIVAIIR